MERATLTVDAKHSDIVAALVAAIEKLARRVEREAARIVAARPFLANVLQFSRGVDRENADAVVKSVTGIDELPVGGDEDLRTKVASGEIGRERGDRLPGRQSAGLGGVVEPYNGRAFLLNRVQRAAVRVEMEVPRPVAGR